MVDNQADEMGCVKGIMASGDVRAMKDAGNESGKVSSEVYYASVTDRDGRAFTYAFLAKKHLLVRCVKKLGVS